MISSSQSLPRIDDVSACCNKLFQELAVISFRHAPMYRWRQVDYRPELSADPGP